MKTNLFINNQRFLINDQLTYAEIPNSNPEVHGLLMNARFIQGLFDDQADMARQKSGELPARCSGKGGSYNREIAEASDLILIHGNGCSRQCLYNMICDVQS